MYLLQLVHYLDEGEMRIGRLVKFKLMLVRCQIEKKIQIKMDFVF